MSEDIVKRLRVAERWLRYFRDGAVPDGAPYEAATEITRLREENARLLAANKDAILHFEAMRDDLKKAEKENARLRMELAEAETRAERDYLRFVEADREEIERMREEVEQYKVDTNELCIENTRLLEENARLREQIRLLTADMTAGDARRKIAEQHAEIERLRADIMERDNAVSGRLFSEEQIAEIERLKMLLDPLPAAAGCQPANAGK